jgi:hypothetical protein
MNAWYGKYIAWLIIPALIFVFACDKKPEDASSKQGPVNPLARYGESMVTAYTKGKRAGLEGNLNSVKKTIQAFHALHDRYPKDLDEIKPLFSSPIDLSVYDYDPDTGQVSLKK